MPAVHGTSDLTRIEAPITLKTYLMCAFAAFGGIFFGYDTGWMGGVLGMPYFIHQYTGLPLYDGITADNLPSTYALSASNKSLMTSILSAGTFFGALVAVSPSRDLFLATCLQLSRVISLMALADDQPSSLVRLSLLLDVFWRSLPPVNWPCSVSVVSSLVPVLVSSPTSLSCTCPRLPRRKFVEHW